MLRRQHVRGRGIQRTEKRKHTQKYIGNTKNTHKSTTKYILTMHKHHHIIATTPTRQLLVTSLATSNSPGS